MRSLQSYEGYMMLDHRNSPGVPDEVMVKAGFSPGAGRGLYESATYTCPYCETVVVMNPQRTRPRAFCRKVGKPICDACDGVRLTGVEMKTMKEIADELLNRAAKGLGVSEIYQSPTLGV